MQVILSSLFVIYLACLFSFFLIMRKANKIVISSLASGDDRRALSLAWAWCRSNKLDELQSYWGSHRFFNVNDFARTQSHKLYLPHVTFTIVSILLYQAIFRPTGLFGLGRCKATPNCSNFAIGCLNRYGYFLALAKIIIRIDSCHAAQPISFSENFK